MTQQEREDVLEMDMAGCNSEVEDTPLGEEFLSPAPGEEGEAFSNAGREYAIYEKLAEDLRALKVGPKYTLHFRICSLLTVFISDITRIIPEGTKQRNAQRPGPYRWGTSQICT